MGNSLSDIPNINFEDMQYAINDQPKTIIINTLDIQHHQLCLIAGTLAIDNEIEILNVHLKQNLDVRIIIYGMNATDKSCLKKYDQLIKLGFYNVYIYTGGMFEWLLLQDVYGNELFPTTTTKIDILKYKGRRHLHMKMLK